MYAATTQEISVSVEPIYLEDQSSPEEGQFMWAYHVRIDNLGSQSVQVLSRYWHITDSIGRIQEVRGAGVVAGTAEKLKRSSANAGPLSARARRAPPRAALRVAEKKETSACPDGILRVGK